MSTVIHTAQRTPLGMVSLINILYVAQLTVYTNKQLQ